MLHRTQKLSALTSVLRRGAVLLLFLPAAMLPAWVLFLPAGVLRASVLPVQAVVGVSVLLLGPSVLLVLVPD